MGLKRNPAPHLREQMPRAEEEKTIGSPLEPEKQNLIKTHRAEGGEASAEATAKRKRARTLGLRLLGPIYRTCAGTEVVLLKPWFLINDLTVKQ